MTAETVKQFQEAVSIASWNMNYADFCRKLNREPDSWTDTKWQALRALNCDLTAFDPNTLAKLLSPESDAVQEPLADSMHPEGL